MPTTPPPFRIDRCYRTNEDLAQFASQMEHVEPELQKHIEEFFDGDQPKEFYLGLMAGYAACVALASQMPMKKFVDFIESTTTFVASKIRKMENGLEKWNNQILKAIKTETEKLLALLEDPHPGLSTWQSAVTNSIQRLYDTKKWGR